PAACPSVGGTFRRLRHSSVTSDGEKCLRRACSGGYPGREADMMGPVGAAAAPEQIREQTSMDKQQEYVLRAIEERDVRFIRLWFTDVLGVLKSVAIAPAELEGAFTEGIGFDGSSIEGLARVSESELSAQPDPATFQILPWRAGPPGTPRMFGDILTPDGQPAAADPRNVLKRALAKAADAGFTFYTHPEVEFYLFQALESEDDPLVPVDNAGYFDHVARGQGHDFRRA